MVIPEERDGKLEDDPNLHPAPSLETSSSSRRGGLVDKPKEQQLVFICFTSHTYQLLLAP